MKPVKIEESLAASEKETTRLLSLFMSTLESTADGILVVSRAGTISTYNERFREMWRLPKEVLNFGEDDKALAHVVDQLKQPRQFLNKVRELYQSEIESFDILEFKDGRIFERYSIPQRIDGVTVGRVWSFRDITQRKLAERALAAAHAELEARVEERTRELARINEELRLEVVTRKEAEENQRQLFRELETANRELVDFAHIVSHDLKAPLRAIGSLAEWLGNDFGERLGPDGRGQLDLLTGRVKRMHALIDGILQYSSLGRVKEVKARVDLNDLVSEVIDFLAPPPGIKITVENRLPSLVCDRTRILQVFQNLLHNAVKFMDKPDGKIGVGGTASNGLWTFHISDSGPGIEKRHFKRVFQLFQTLAPRDAVEGTGIGLAIVKKIVEMHGGKVRIDSAPGRGSTFFFTLPEEKK